MNIILSLVSILLIFIYGLSINAVFSLFNEKSILYKLPFYFGIGSGFIALQLFLFSVIGFKFNLLNVITPIFIISAFASKKIKFRKKIKKFHLKLSFIEEGLILLILITIIYALFESLLRPLPSWDGWSAFYFEGKAFYIDGYLNPKAAIYSGVSNPPLIALLLTFVFNVIGSVDDRSSLMLFTVFYISTASILFVNLRKKLSLTYSLIFTLLFVTTPNVLRHAGNVDVGHADIVVGFYLLASTICLLKFINKMTLKKFVITQLFLVFGALVKDEGIIFFLTGELILFYFIAKRKEYMYVLKMLIGIFLLGSWILFKYFYGIPQNPFFLHIPQLDRADTIIKYAFWEFLNFIRWNFIWLIGLLIYVGTKLTSDTRVIVFLLLIQLMGYISIYFTTPVNPIVHMQGSFDRLLLHIFPLFLYGSGLSFANMRYFKNEI